MISKRFTISGEHRIGRKYFFHQNIFEYDESHFYFPKKVLIDKSHILNTLNTLSL